MKLRLLFTFIFSIFLLVIGSVPTFAQTSTPGITLTAEVGFDGYYRRNSWAPVYINVANGGLPVEGEVRVIVNPDSATQRVIYNAPISLPTQSDKRVTLYVYISGFSPSLDVQLVDENGRILSELNTDPITNLSLDTLLYGVVTSDPGEFTFLENVLGKRLDTAVAFLDLNELPEKASAWNALDVLVLHDSDSGQLTVAQQDSLAKWVDTGGQLVLTGGGNWQKTTAVFQEQLPVTITGSESVADLPAFAEKIGVNFRDPGPYIITTSSLSSGELLYHEEGLPILARQPIGRGSLYFLALDPVLAPLLDWDGSERMWTEIARQVPPVTLWGQGPQDNSAASNAVKTLTAQTLPSVWQIAFLMLVYILIVGPVNYIFLKRRKRTEQAWVTIPLLVLLFSGVAYLVGFQLRGNDAVLNQMDVVYSQVDSEYGRAQSLIGLYSPKRTTYDLLFKEGALARPFNDSYGSGLSGGGNIEAVTYGSDVTISGIRIDISDVATFTANNTVPAIALTGDGAITVEDGNIYANLTIQNESDLFLETVTLLVGNQIFALGDMPPGATETLNQDLGRGTASYNNIPFTSNAGTILGSFEYYNDAKLYPRYQLLESMDNDSNSSGLSTPIGNDTALLLAWSEGAQIVLETVKGSSATQATTLHVVEIPLKQNVVGTNEITLPVGLLNWQELDSSGLYDATIQNLYLNEGWIEFEYTPWPEFQGMVTTGLAILLAPPDEHDTAVLPEVRLWDWVAEEWVVQEDVTWGETAVPLLPYLGENNSVRIRLEDQTSTYGKSVDAVYPLLTGYLEN